MSASRNESRITLHGESTFEHVVRQLHLSPEEYATSVELKNWVRKNKNEKYVPLLDAPATKAAIALVYPEYGT